MVIVAVVVWQAITAAGAPDPLTARGTSAATLDVAVLVFREGLECVLVLAAITAGLRPEAVAHRRPIVWGVVAGMVATVATWFIAVGALTALGDSVPALDLQAATGLLAIIVLLVVMNWFFHKVYWTGWIGMHNKRKRSLLERSAKGVATRQRVFFGLAALGFTSFYREGFEVVLFLQSYRLRLGSTVVFGGVVIGAALCAAVALLTFVARQRLPYKKMLVVTGVMLGGVLVVMVGEQAQEMQLAHWLTTTPLHWLDALLPSWTGTWFATFPTVETLAAQVIAAALILGAYFIARRRSGVGTRDSGLEARDGTPGSRLGGDREVPIAAGNRRQPASGAPGGPGAAVPEPRAASAPQRQSASRHLNTISPR